MIGIIAGISGEILTRKLQEKGFQVALVAGREGESGTDIANVICIADLREKKRIIDFFHDHQVHYILVGTGHVLALELSKELKCCGFVLSNNPDASLLAKNKIRYKERLITEGFDTPRFIVSKGDVLPKVDSVIEKLGLPCVVKSAIDCILPQKANSREELEQAIQEVSLVQSDILIEEYIIGTDITVPVLVSKDGATAIMISYYSKSKECHLKGFNTESRKNITLSQMQEQKVRNYCEQAAIKTGMEGLCRLDVMITEDDRISILEANSVMVTGIHPNQIEYGRFFLEKERIDFAEILVNVALEKFGILKDGK
jgi:D-alanine-D-alanine ligase